MDLPFPEAAVAVTSTTDADEATVCGDAAVTDGSVAIQTTPKYTKVLLRPRQQSVKRELLNLTNFIRVGVVPLLILPLFCGVPVSGCF